MYFKQITGKTGEDLACKYLSQNNYSIIQRNFHCYQGEIDIICKDENKKQLVFIEVKTRTNSKYGTPADSVNYQKQSHIFKACQYYIYQKKINNVPIRIDVIEIYLYQDTYKINHIQQIF